MTAAVSTQLESTTNRRLERMNPPKETGRYLMGIRAKFKDPPEWRRADGLAVT
jgi:hypothetical protein